MTPFVNNPTKGEVADRPEGVITPNHDDVISYLKIPKKNPPLKKGDFIISNK